MITVISGTNRSGSKTLQVAHLYQRYFQEAGAAARVLSLEGIDVNDRTPHFEEIEASILIPTEKFVFITPEYNGSIPGVMKAFIDMCRIPVCFYNKKALLTGVADGRAGNLRGMEHFTGILHHMGMLVHPNKLPISVINKIMNSAGEFTDERTINTVKKQIGEFIAF